MPEDCHLEVVTMIGFVAAWQIALIVSKAGKECVLKRHKYMVSIAQSKLVYL
jgi:hypothetical protein